MKIKKILFTLAMILGLTSCGVNGTGIGNSSSDVGGNPSSSECTDGVCGGDVELNLDVINEYLKNDPTWTDMNNSGNKMTLIPFTHINGPKAEWNFFAFVNFEYNATSYFKYQVTYLSCTCRAASVNYWQTAYVELTCANSLEEVKLKRLSFENDGTGHYIAGFWGDSGTNGHDINKTGITYEDIKTGFIPFLVGKTYKELSSYDGYQETVNGTTVTYDDTVFAIPEADFNNKMEGVMFHDDHQVTLDDFSGASVSTNNILRMLIPLMEYHAANNI